MSYTLFILSRAQNELARLPEDIYPHIREAIRALAHDPRPRGCIKLTGRDGWRIRVRNYRVIYEIDASRNTLTVLHVGHRRDVYR